MPPGYILIHITSYYFFCTAFSYVNTNNAGWASRDNFIECPWPLMNYTVYNIWGHYNRFISSYHLINGFCQDSWHIGIDKDWRECKDRQLWVEIAIKLTTTIGPYTLSNLCQCLYAKNLDKIHLLNGNLI
jgi:hypothetical protein